MIEKSPVNIMNKCVYTLRCDHKDCKQSISTPGLEDCFERVE